MLHSACGEGGWGEGKNIKQLFVPQRMNNRPVVRGTCLTCQSFPVTLLGLQQLQLGLGQELNPQTNAARIRWTLTTTYKTTTIR